MTDQYEGRSTLEILKAATRYNEALLQEVVRLLPSPQVRRPDASAAPPASPQVATAPQVLDFGAGIGTFAHALQSRRPDIQVTAYEPDASQCADIAKSGMITNAYSDFSKIPDQHFDLIYSLNVLEHIEDDAQALKTLKSKLKPNGKIYIFVPAFQILYSGFDRSVGHHRRYRKQDLARIAHKAQLEVTQLSYYDSLGFFVALIFKWLMPNETELSLGSVLIYDRVIFPISRLIDRLLSRFVGKNAHMVCRGR